jgi:hypothetical protein
MSSEGITLFFAKGGHGKGTLSTELARLLTIDGHTVLIMDYERHKTEWWHRIRTLIPEMFWKQIYFAEPEFIIGSVDKMEEFIKEWIAATNATAIIIDSYGWAKPRATTKGSADPLSAEAIGFGEVLGRLGIPAVVTTHMAKSSKTEPYGSIYLTNVCRLVWQVVREEPPVPMPNAMRLRLRWHKGNGFEKQPDASVLFRYDGVWPISSEWSVTAITLIDKITYVLRQKDMTHQQVYDAVTEKFPNEAVKPENVRQLCLQYSEENSPRQRFVRLPKSHHQASQIFAFKRV